MFGIAGALLPQRWREQGADGYLSDTREVRKRGIPIYSEDEDFGITSGCTTTQSCPGESGKPGPSGGVPDAVWGVLIDLDFNLEWQWRQFRPAHRGGAVPLPP